jgi:hypothetical protein
VARRDDWLERAAGRQAGGRPGSAVREVAVALGLGWLVLMTLWGVGRSGFPDHEGRFLVAGLIGAAVVVGGRLVARRRGPGASGGPEDG